MPFNSFQWESHLIRFWLGKVNYAFSLQLIEQIVAEINSSLS